VPLGASYTLLMFHNPYTVNLNLPTEGGKPSPLPYMGKIKLPSIIF
jgi:hypothetical protein